MTNKTTIQISKDTRDELFSLKEPATSYDDVLRRLLEEADRRTLTPDRIHENPDLGPNETETLFEFMKSDDRFWFRTREAGLMRRLLLHPEFELNPSHSDSSQIDGTLPIGCLSVGISPRKATGHAEIISDGVFDYRDTGDTGAAENRGPDDADHWGTSREASMSSSGVFDAGDTGTAEQAETEQD